MGKDRNQMRSRADKKKKKEALTGAQKLRRMSLNFLPIGIALLIIGILAGVRAGRLIFALAFTAPALPFLVMGIFFRKFPVGEDLPPKRGQGKGLSDAGQVHDAEHTRNTTSLEGTSGREDRIDAEHAAGIDAPQKANIQQKADAQQTTDNQYREEKQQ
ncbi:MAG: hypothetical protein LIV24_12130 [Eubacterium sp.]|nr:hypothetical protein [Eubacterium sp.]